MSDLVEKAPWETDAEIPPWETPDPNAFKMPQNILESVFPSSFDAFKMQPPQVDGMKPAEKVSPWQAMADAGQSAMGGSFSGAVGASAPAASTALLNDVTSLPQRALGAATSDQKLGDPNTYGGKGFVEQLKPAFKQAYGVPEGVTEMVGRIATDPINLLAPAGEAVRGATSFAGRGAAALNRGSGKLAQELSGVSEEALRLGSTKAGRQELRQASGKQAEIGQKISDAVGDFHDYLPEKGIVENALKGMPPVDISSTIKVLQNSKISPRGGFALPPAQQAANNAIDDVIRGLRKRQTPIPSANEAGFTGLEDQLSAIKKNANAAKVSKMPASEAYQLRRDLDYTLDFDKPETKILDAALKNARTELKNQLLQSAGKSGNKEYALAMKDWSRKLNTLDKIQSRLGISKNTRDARAEAFVKNLFGRNSANKQELMKELDDVFGTNLLKESKMTFLADELGDGGKAALFPRHSTGRATMATGAAGLASSIGLGSVPGAVASTVLAAYASPAAASRIVLPTTQMIEKALSEGFLQSPRAQALGRKFLQASNDALKTRIFTQLQREIEKENK